ncbi:MULTISPECIES: VOC family protein [Methylococcus]|uniref:VOC family protein n=1 Tax=Methylococcus capsulatus TaxID=414 RepID=A0ABZ2F2X3_METCP|nr:MULTISPECIES: VOC family protein [Methylococcus]MDF9391702.1 VOC family protein [Methylococcus capsulatus]
MSNVANWFEIPVKDMARAKAFYQEVLKTTFKDEAMGSYQMAIFASEGPAVSGMLIAGEHYEPSQTGAVVYLNGGTDLSQPLQRAVEHGASVLVPKTPIHDGACGYFAQFLDSEGNRVGLYSPA